MRKQVDEESENRARRRFTHFREEFAATITPTTFVRPSPELFIGPRGRLRAIVEQAITDGKEIPLNMLVEMARDKLITGWDVHYPTGGELSTDLDSWIEKVNSFYKDDFVPALESITEVGLLAIKYHADVALCRSIVDELVETFNASRQLTFLKASALGSKDHALPFWRPAFDVYLAIRSLATYAVHRNRFEYVSVLLPRYVRWFTVDDQSRTEVPLVFWPFSGHIGMPDMREGRNRTLWAERIRGAWSLYFGTFEKYLTAALQLEVVLEFNSYLLLNVDDPAIQQFEEQLQGKAFVYLPDFWTNRLDPVIPMAEHFYDTLSSDARFPDSLAIEKIAENALFDRKTPQQRLAILGGFLHYLQDWQGQVMMQQHRFPFMFHWPGRLGVLVEAQKPTKARWPAQSD